MLQLDSSPMREAISFLRLLVSQSWKVAQRSPSLVLFLQHDPQRGDGEGGGGGGSCLGTHVRIKDFKIKKINK